MNDLGQKIKILRTNNKMTQNDLATRLNVTKSVISAYENSLRLPSYDILLKLSNLFSVSTDFLLGHTSNCSIDVSGLNDNEIEGINLLISSLKKSRNID